MGYKTIWTNNGPLLTKAVIETAEFKPSIDKKAFQRKSINDTVFDINDAVADNAKMISLLLTFIDRIYAVLPVAETDLIPAADKTLIDYTLAAFKATNTRADVQLAAEGTAMIDKILARQASVGVIVA